MDDMIHPNEKGVELLSDAVAEYIKKYADYKNPQAGKNEPTYVKQSEKTIQ